MTGATGVTVPPLLLDEDEELVAPVELVELLDTVPELVDAVVFGAAFFGATFSAGIDTPPLTPVTGGELGVTDTDDASCGVGAGDVVDLVAMPAPNAAANGTTTAAARIPSRLPPAPAVPI